MPPAPREQAPGQQVELHSAPPAGGKGHVATEAWQDAVNAVLGAWLVLSPWAIGYAGETAAMINAVVIGLGLIAAALGARPCGALTARE
jgi:hypothetical protein